MNTTTQIAPERGAASARATASPARRSLLKGAVWAAPTAAVAVGAPAYALSGAGTGQLYFQVNQQYALSRYYQYVFGDSQAAYMEQNLTGALVPGGNTAAECIDANTTNTAGFWVDSGTVITNPTFTATITASGKTAGMTYHNPFGGGTPGSVSTIVQGTTGTLIPSQGGLGSGTWTATSVQVSDTAAGTSKLVIESAMTGTVSGDAQSCSGDRTYFGSNVMPSTNVYTQDITVTLCITGGTVTIDGQTASLEDAFPGGTCITGIYELGVNGHS